MFIQKYRSIRFPHIPIQDYIKSNSINKNKVMKNAIDSLKEIRKFLGVKREIRDRQIILSVFDQT